MTAEAAVGEGNDKRMEAGGPNQAGGVTTSSKFRQQLTIGELLASHAITTSKFRIVPGLFRSSFSTSPVIPPSDLDLLVLYAKTDPFGQTIPAKTWQQDNDPIFIWEPPPTGPDVAGYSYALDGAPDDAIDTSDTSFNVATSTPNTLADGIHTFSVKAINTLGNAGSPISLDVWVDRNPPEIAAYSPSPGALLKTANPAVSATVSDAGSGVSEAGITVLVNGSPASSSFAGDTGVITAIGGTWNEGTNSIELRVADLVGNAQAPLVWSLTVDTQPPDGTLMINSGAVMTTSVYVSLRLSASDAISGVARMLVSSDALTGYVEEPYVALRELWKLNPVRGIQHVYVKFVDGAGNISAPVSDEIDLALLSPETAITSGPAGFTPNRAASFAFMCPEGDCVFSFAFDNDEWSDWSASTSAVRDGLAFGNHYFRVKAAKDVNGTEDIQPDEEDPSPAERTWIVGVQPSILTLPKGPHIKLWRLE